MENPNEKPQETPETEAVETTVTPTPEEIQAAKDKEIAELKAKGYTDEDIAFLDSLKEKEEGVEPPTEAPAVELPEEAQRYLKLKNDPVKSQLLDIIENDAVEPFFNAIAPKGKDYSKLDLTNKDVAKDVYKEWLIADGAEGEELTNELAEFEKLNRVNRKVAIEKAVKELSAKSVEMPSDWKAILKAESERQKAIKTNWAQSAEQAQKNIDTEIKNIVGKKINGITITKEDAVDIYKIANSYVQPVITKDGKYSYTVKESLDAALALTINKKAIEAKDKKISDLTNFINKRIRPSLGADGGNPSSNNNPTQTRQATKQQYVGPM
jgi:hypothetical protein